MRFIINLTGILAAFFFVANFLTCYAMPWSKVPACWKGKYPGPDKCDHDGYSRVSAFHKAFVILTIFFTAVHIILAILT